MTRPALLPIALGALLFAGAVWSGTALGQAPEEAPEQAPERAPERAPLPAPAPAGLPASGEAVAPAPAVPPPKPGEPPAEAAPDGSFAPVEPALPAPGPEQDPEAFAACTAELAALGVSFARLDPIEGARACGAARPLRVSAIGAVEIRPPTEMRCPVARSLALWVERVVAPLSVLYLDDPLAAIVVGTGYQCRDRRGDGSDRISEHAFANAIDVMGLAFASGAVMAIGERGATAGPEPLLQAGMRGGACAFFTTVLGPRTNAAHSGHLHLDMAERRGGYRICE